MHFQHRRPLYLDGGEMMLSMQQKALVAQCGEQHPPELPP